MKKIGQILIKDIIESPWQGRLLNFNKQTEEEQSTGLKRLAENIKENGLVTPVLVRPANNKKNKFELIDGHRRVEACRLIGLEKITAIIDDINDKEAQAQSVIGNLLRDDLYNIERALAFKKILDDNVFKSKRELSKAIGKDETYVGDLLNTLKMDSRIISDLINNRTTDDVRLLRAIRRVEQTDNDGLSEKQWELYQKFKEQELTRKEIMDIIKNEREHNHKPVNFNVNPRRIELLFAKKIPKEKRADLVALLKKQIEDFLKEN